MIDFIFESPLRIVGGHPSDGADFGPVPLEPGTLALRRELHRRLLSVVDEVPRPLRPQAEAIVSGYSGSPDDFFRAFYPPVWSFLRWAAASEAARNAHSLALFLHLWDDHLCDGQLPTTMLSLDLRSRAWSRFQEASEEAFRVAGLDPAGVAERLESYVVATHRPPETENLQGYVARFVDEIAIWTIAPAAAGFASGGAAAARSLETAIVEFSVAWRLLDDLQDVAEDAASRKRTAVWHLLDEDLRSRWETGTEIPAGTRRRLLGEVLRHLSKAERAAYAGGWSPLVDELRAAAVIAVPPESAAH